MLEATYVAFRHALELMVLNTTCTCQACRNLPNLDLKFFVHYGTYMLQPFPAYTELIGTDVNTVHRLTKNSVTEETGITAYVLYSQAAVDALGIGDLCGPMTSHTESYEHIGEVSTHIQDMHPIWERERVRQRTVVRPEDAMFIMEHDYPLEPVLMWDYVTAPECIAIITGSSINRVTNRTKGRIGLDAAYQCAHGENVHTLTIVDWQPHVQFTFEAVIVAGISNLTTIQLTSIEGGTRIAFLDSKCRGDPFILRILFDVFGRVFYFFRGGIFRGHFQVIHERIEQEIAAGTLVQPAALDVASDEIDKAMAQSLAMQS